MKIILKGLYENSYIKGNCRYVTLTTDVASRATDNFIMTLTYEVQVNKDFEFGDWCISVEDMIESMEKKYPYTCSRKDVYLDLKGTKVKRLIKQTK